MFAVTMRRRKLSSAPVRQGRVQPLQEWTLASLIAVSLEKGALHSCGGGEGDTPGAVMG